MAGQEQQHLTLFLRAMEFHGSLNGARCAAVPRRTPSHAHKALERPETTTQQCRLTLPPVAVFSRGACTSKVSELLRTKPADRERPANTERDSDTRILHVQL